jgi:hypothetical protein
VVRAPLYTEWATDVNSSQLLYAHVLWAPSCDAVPSLWQPRVLPVSFSPAVAGREAETLLLTALSRDDAEVSGRCLPGCAGGVC